jgi:Transposase DDE domain
MLPKFYQTHLKNQLGQSQYLLLTLLIEILQLCKQVKLETLAARLPIPILFESRRKKIQRFLSLPELNVEKIWFPIMDWWLTQTFKEGEVIYLVMDRTSWMEINLMMVSVVWGKRGFPIYWQLLKKKGSSNFQEQSEILGKVLSRFERYKVVVLGDREFCSVQLGEWLNQQAVYFCLRVKKNEYIEVEKDLIITLRELCLEPGMSLFFHQVRMTKTKRVKGFNVACKRQEKQFGWASEDPWFILTNLGTLEQAISSYEKRFSIEEMFRDYKSGGYNLENTNVKDDRLMVLILLIAIAYTATTIVGREVSVKSVEKYVGRVAEKEREERRHSYFYVGLYAQSWVSHLSNPIVEIVNELLSLSPHKRDHYRRGMRAMNLILSAL